MFSQHRYASFYLPIGRIWELLLGVFAAFYLPTDDSTKYILYLY
jgi:peptidoglycan/LPS O-acetylase OafA/YrhL